MLNVLRQSSRCALLLCLSPGLFAPRAFAQVTATQRQLERLDFAVSGVGEFTKGVSGTNYQGVALTQNASNTLGALITLRYTKSLLLGAEVNYGYARYTENYASNPMYLTSGAQTKASEYTVGYVAHGPELFGFRSFGSAGVGSLAFTPTPFGGQNLPERARLAFYYDVGLEQSIISKHFGVRAQFRQVFFKAPDFDQNYLTINKRTYTVEPGIGVYLHF